LPDGLTGKQISIGLLAKHGFDLRGCLGTLLKPKFDLTSLTNIRTAYEAAFGKCKQLDDMFSERDLHLLEASRHVIVHRAGVVDAEFVARTKHFGIKAEEGKLLPLSGTTVSALVDSAIKAGAAVLGFVDARLANDIPIGPGTEPSESVAAAPGVG
jgi:hypothetical protein